MPAVELAGVFLDSDLGAGAENIEIFNKTTKSDVIFYAIYQLTTYKNTI